MSYSEGMLKTVLLSNCLMNTCQELILHNNTQFVIGYISVC